jgi:hypothetical protein
MFQCVNPKSPSAEAKRVHILSAKLAATKLRTPTFGDAGDFGIFESTLRGGSMFQDVSEMHHKENTISHAFSFSSIMHLRINHL